ncbi:hypothetical protein D9M69_565540 [compost metagenome]
MIRVAFVFLNLLALVSGLLHVYLSIRPDQRWNTLRRVNRRVGLAVGVLGIVIAIMFILSNLDTLTN